VASKSQHIKYTASDIERYLSGGMSTKEMYALEKEALDDPFLAEVIEGFESLPPEKWKDTLISLKQEIATKDNKNVAIIPLWKQSWKLAAGVIILGISIAVGYWVWNNNQTHADLAKNISTNSESSAAVTDSASFNNTPALDSAGYEIHSNNTSKTAIAAVQEPTIQTKDIPPTPITNPSYQQDTSMIYRPSIDSRKYKDLTASSQTVASTDIQNEKESQQPIAEEKVVALEKVNNSNIVTNSNNNASNNNITFSKTEAAVAKKHSAETIDDEVVSVNGYGLTRNKTIQPSATNLSGTPIGGWDAFKQYVALNNQLPVDLRKKYSGKAVTLYFRIKKNGKPTQILVQQSLSTKCDTEAIRLIENGPRWNYVKNGLNTATVNINF